MIGRFLYFMRKFRHPIRKGDLVVDVGSGGDPHPRADVIVERSIAGGDRTVPFLRSTDAVIADIAALPFKENAFDFAICSHVMEHLTDPQEGAAELGRVARSGYIETPSDIHEYMFPMGWHKWLVSRTANGLRFTAKPSLFLDEVPRNFFAPLWGRDRKFMAWFWSRRDDFFVQYYWEGSPVVEVDGELPECFDTTEEVHHEMGSGVARRGPKFWAFKAASLVRYPHF